MRIQLSQLVWLQHAAKGVACRATAFPGATNLAVAGGEGNKCEHDTEDGEHANFLLESESPSEANADRLSVELTAVGFLYAGTANVGLPAATCCKALRARAASIRRRGSFSSKPSRTMPRAPACSVATCGADSTESSTDDGVLVSNGARPSTALYRVTPSAYRSEGGPKCPSRTVSGAR